MTNKLHTLKVVENNQKASDIYEIILENPGLTDIKPCQFFNLGIKAQGNPILKRPISVSQVTEKGIHFVIKQLGEGTQRLCKLNPADEVLAVGSLGNGFDLSQNLQTEKLLLIGGGIGTAPLLELAKKAKEEGKQVDVVLGYLNEAYLVDEFFAYTDNLLICTMDNLQNQLDIQCKDQIQYFRGNAVEAVESLELELKDYTITACGPDIMLEKTKEAFEHQCEALYLVTEERMACGMGACLVCAKKVIQNDEEKMVRTCIEGPVFLGSEVQF